MISALAIDICTNAGPCLYVDPSSGPGLDPGLAHQAQRALLSRCSGAGLGGGVAVLSIVLRQPAKLLPAPGHVTSAARMLSSYLSSLSPYELGSLPAGLS